MFKMWIEPIVNLLKIKYTKDQKEYNKNEI